MGQSLLRTASIFAIAVMLQVRVAQANPEQTVRDADQVLQEVMASPGMQIPKYLLTQAQGVAIIPNVIKIGFVAAGRRGHGVVLVRDREGAWGLPQFVTLTGGSVGWQAGVQGSDIVLVFTTRKSVDGLMTGKFTIGADAAVAAGPIGRNAAAATDERLKAEILSYSRSRGLFAGIAIDGSVIEVDANSQLAYYGAPMSQGPVELPQSASQLRQDLATLSQDDQAPVVVQGPGTFGPAPTRLAILRQSLKTNSSQMNSVLDQNWQRFLALPREVFEGDQPPSLLSLQQAQQQYAQVAQAPRYQALASRPEFQATYESLREYTQELAAASPPPLALPPPPVR